MSPVAEMLWAMALDYAAVVEKHLLPGGGMLDRSGDNPLAFSRPRERMILHFLFPDCPAEGPNLLLQLRDKSYSLRTAARGVGKVTGVIRPYVPRHLASCGARQFGTPGGGIRSP